jgi:RimJ/RimL family protein N-acetyltransferase
MSLADRTATIERWEADWRAGGDLMAGVFIGAEIVGGCGLHRRIGPGGVEIGYWIHPAYTRRRLATAAARLLTDSAFSVPDISHVEIHHDQANQPSGRIPRRLGYELIREAPDEPTAPGEVGISCIWRTTRENWSRAQEGPS